MAVSKNTISNVLVLLGIVVGAIFLGVEYGWKTGAGIGLIAWAIVPFRD